MFLVFVKILRFKVKYCFDQFGLGVIYCGFVDLYFEFVNYFMVYVGYIFFGLG